MPYSMCILVSYAHYARPLLLLLAALGRYVPVSVCMWLFFPPGGGEGGMLGPIALCSLCVMYHIYLFFFNEEKKG